ncbi:uncharacterized protein [Atheta coriaria]|uniref:uncharacterized protein n=1 Tax=Dalotia coriaria TaxID=877792 RepID=UPI0031F39B26
MILEQQSSTNVASYYQGYKYSSIQQLHKLGDMHGVKRVLIFCLMMAVLPMILIITPLYLRHSVYADGKFEVAESDVLAIMDGVSSVFCSSHSLHMNSTFNAFQLRSSPQLSSKKKHLRLKKSMELPDDTLEYFGFFLLANSTVRLKACSRYPGSRLLVVRGDKRLDTCGLMDHNMKKVGATMDKDHQQVKVIFEDAEELNSSSEETPVPIKKNTTAEKKVEKPVEEFVKKRLNKAKNKTSKATPVLESTIKHNLHAEALRLEEIDDVEQKTAKMVESRNPRRHYRKRIEMEIERLQAQLDENIDPTAVEEIDDENAELEVDENEQPITPESRPKRDIQQMLDGGIEHGGNAIDFSQRDSTINSVSSFEEDLLTCYDGSILLAHGFDPSDKCTNVYDLDDGTHLETEHNVVSDGYYYYIFYSDNDIENNIIHAVFDVFKPTFQYMNNTKDKECINVTECHFPIQFLSDETVVVEVPTHDGIEVDEDNMFLLVSTCHPRVGIYIVFPISVMLLILGCGFL